MKEEADETASTPRRPFSQVLQQGSRTIGYALIPPQESREKSSEANAIVYFYPLSGCSLVLEPMASSVCNYACSVICVDRPECGATSALSPVREDEDFALHRIQGHVKDVLAVLKHHNIRRVFALGICLGHPYAVELCRQVTNDTSNTMQLHGLTLVAPFVGTAAPDSWWVARLGAAVPQCILQGCTEAAAAVTPFMVSHFLNQHKVRKLITPAEQSEFGWKEDDFFDVCELAVETSEHSKKAQSIEAQLGVSSVWQTDVCDAFAVEMGLASATFGEDKDRENPTTTKPSGKELPIRIYTTPHDKLASLEAVEWLVKRCYGGMDSLVVLDKIHSHEAMTFLAGPPRNPVLLHQIAREWGLLDANGARADGTET